jgi:hypothetical protein
MSTSGTTPTPTVSKEAELWILRLTNPNGKPQEYRCTTEEQARQLALVLTPSEKAPEQATAKS